MKTPPALDSADWICAIAGKSHHCGIPMDTASLAPNRPSAYAVVPGPGLLNTSAALLTAYSMNAPVLGLIGQIPDADIGRGIGHLHEIRDQAGIIARLVDFSDRVKMPAEAPQLVAQAVAAMFTG